MVVPSSRPGMTFTCGNITGSIMTDVQSPQHLLNTSSVTEKLVTYGANDTRVTWYSLVHICRSLHCSSLLSSVNSSDLHDVTLSVFDTKVVINSSSNSAMISFLCAI